MTGREVREDSEICVHDAESLQTLEARDVGILESASRFARESAGELLCGIVAPSSSERSSSCNSRVYFALITQRAGQHHQLLSALQTVVVAPLVREEGISEFRVLAATPPSFVAEECTFIVFELIVPSPRAITDVEVKQWRDKLKPDIRLVIATPPPSRTNDSWNWERARAVLARAMALGVDEEQPSSQRTEVRGAAAYINACLQRTDKRDDDETLGTSRPRVGSSLLHEPPSLFIVSKQTRKRERLLSGSSLMTPEIAAELRCHLPPAIQWKSAWRLAYSPRMHGVSLQTFFRRMAGEAQSLLLLQDHSGNVFGGFAPVSWQVGDRYYGNGECFVFKFSQTFPKNVRTLQSEEKEPATTGIDAAGIAEPFSSTASEREAGELVKQALSVLEEWKREIAVEAEKSARLTANQTNLVTSPSEALDEFFGESFCGTDRDGSHANDQAPRLMTHEACVQTPQITTALSSNVKSTEGLTSGTDVEDGSLEVFNWVAPADSFFLFSDAECLAMGGGSAFALYIEKDLLHGMSEPCSTFASSMLSSSQNFIVNELECWVFDDPHEAEEAR